MPARDPGSSGKGAGGKPANRKGGGKGQYHQRPRLVNVAEEGNEDYNNEEEAEEAQQEEGDDQEEEYDEEEIGELTEQLEALTVTSEKLKALTLGRKFYGSKGGSKGGKSSSQDLSAKKQNTKCSVCGQYLATGTKTLSAQALLRAREVRPREKHRLGCTSLRKLTRRRNTRVSSCTRSMLQGKRKESTRHQRFSLHQQQRQPGT